MWLYVPGMSSPSAQVAGGLSLEFPSLCDCAVKALAASATWRGKPLLPQAWSRQWKRGGYIRHLSGLTFSPLTLAHGVASFISSLRETHARTIASPEKAPALTVTASSPPKLSVSPMKAGLILSSARTCRGTRTDSLKPLSRHWSDWATSLRQEYSARPKPEIPCGASDCSSWPSARTSDTNGAGKHGDGGIDLRTAASSWHAPRCNDPEKRGQISDDPRNGLAGQSEHWMAPNVPNGGRSTAHAEQVGNTMYHEGKKVQMGLEAQVKSWASPKASDPEKAGPNMRGSKGDIPLPGQAAQWPGPQARDFKGVNQESPLDHNARPLNEVASHFLPPSYLDRPIAAGSMSSTAGPNSNQPSVQRKLNPIFVEALMRWPTGLSGFERLEMAWTQWWLLMPTYLSELCSPREVIQGSLL
jgi:hypothetical protein